jgi:hypothetical protein
MALEKYSIGGAVVENEAFEAFADIPQNRVLIAEKLTADPPVKPEIVEGLSTVEEVFGHFKPKIEMDFETEEGTARKETLRFNNLADFGIKGITTQSAFLGDLTMKSEQYKKIIKQLKTNKLLKAALANADSKQGLIDSLNALIKELEQAR